MSTTLTFKNPSAPGFSEIASMSSVDLVVALFDADAEIERLLAAVDAQPMLRDKLSAVMEYWVVAHKRINARLQAEGVISAIRATQRLLDIIEDATDEEYEHAVYTMETTMSVPGVQRILNLSEVSHDDRALEQTPKELEHFATSREEITERLKSSNGDLVNELLATA